MAKYLPEMKQLMEKRLNRKNIANVFVADPVLLNLRSHFIYLTFYHSCYIAPRLAPIAQSVSMETAQLRELCAAMISS